MRDITYFRIVLFVTLIVVHSECRRFKRQDLIPFPRVGKRNHQLVDAAAAGAGRTNMEDTLANLPVLLQDVNGSWLTSLSNMEAKDEENQGYSGSDDVLPSVWKFSEHKEGNTLPPRRYHTSKSLSVEPHHRITHRQERPSSLAPLETPTFFNSLLLRRLLRLLDTQEPAEMEPRL